LVFVFAAGLAVVVGRSGSQLGCASPKDQTTPDRVPKRGGLIARARLDRRSYPIGNKTSAKDFRELKIDRDNFHGDWSYVIGPRAGAVTD
jgi:hypothetical protein